MVKNKFLHWFPGIVSEVLAVIFCIIYAVIDGEDVTMYIQLIGSALLPFVVPIINTIGKKQLSLGLSVGVAVFVFFASDLGSGMHFYDKVYCWDVIMHGIFGFLCAYTVFYFLVQYNGGKLKVGFLIVILLSTLGVAALWEIWEYLADTITGGDSQRIAEAIALGKSPVSDTMEDIMIAIVGIVVFYITLLIDKFNHYKIYTKLCGFKGFQDHKHSNEIRST